MTLFCPPPLSLTFRDLFATPFAFAEQLQLEVTLKRDVSHLRNLVPASQAVIANFWCGLMTPNHSHVISIINAETDPKQLWVFNVQLYQSNFLSFPT